MTDQNDTPTQPQQPLPTPQERAIDTLLNVALERAGTDPLAMLQEGWMKVELLRGLLEAGYTIREGSAVDGENWILRLLEDKVLNGRKAASIQDHRGDIRIEDPKLRIELKVVSEFGSKEKLQKRDPELGNHKDFTVDVERVSRRECEAAMLVIPLDPYEDARQKRDWIEPRGRTPKILLDALFPRPEHVDLASLKTFQTNYNGTNYLIRIGKTARTVREANRIRLALAVLGLDDALWPTFRANATTDPKCFAIDSWRDFIIDF